MPRAKAEKMADLNEVFQNLEDADVDNEVMQMLEAQPLEAMPGSLVLSDNTIPAQKKLAVLVSTGK